MAARVSLRAVAALFLERQHLDRPRRRRLSARGVVEFASDTGGIQLDSINVVDRAHYLTLWSRFGPYDKAALDRLAYRRRLLFEYWAHAACLVPAEHFPSWRWVMNAYADRPRYRSWALWARKNQETVRAVEQAIRDRGPLSNADFERPTPKKSTGWWDWKPAAHALDYLWMSGRTLVHSRRHFQKRFDLAERVLPDAVGLSPMLEDAFARWHMRQSLHAMGAATESDLRGYLTFPSFTLAERRKVITQMQETGEVVEVEVEGLPARKAKPRWLALAEDLPALARAGRRRAPRGTTILSPFDSLLWYRDRVQRLFGFDYKIQVYIPVAQRRHGYYLMPIYHDGQLVGRLDAKAHREARWLEVKSVTFEPWFAAGKAPPAAGWGFIDRDAALAGLGEALASLSRFVQADRVTVARSSPAKLAAPLRREVAK
jgi:uncharacterized protein